MNCTALPKLKFCKPDKENLTRSNNKLFKRLFKDKEKEKFYIVYIKQGKISKGYSLPYLLPFFCEVKIVNKRPRITIVPVSMALDIMLRLDIKMQGINRKQAIKNFKFPRGVRSVGAVVAAALPIISFDLSLLHQKFPIAKRKYFRWNMHSPRDVSVTVKMPFPTNKP
jgi:hypothetical protein